MNILSPSRDMLTFKQGQYRAELEMAKLLRGAAANQPKVVRDAAERDYQLARAKAAEWEC